MKLKSFKQHLVEDIQRSEAQSLYNEFKQKIESRYKEIQPKFTVEDKNHIIDQIVKRSSPANISGEPNNIQITTEELKHIFDVITDRFFRSKEEGGISTQISPDAIFMVNPTGEWEFQHKIFFDEKKHYRCVIYAVKINVEKKVNAKGKEYLKVMGIDDLKLITIQPSDRDGKDNPKYRFTNGIVEAINEETLNEIED